MEKIKYTIENKYGDMLIYIFNNPLKSRAKALEQIKIWRGESKSFEGIKMSLSIFNYEKISTFPILTGKKMNSVEILELLQTENDILNSQDYPSDLQFMVTKTPNGEEYKHLIDQFLFLYSFTLD
jgi:hypothetical protein